MMLKQDGSVWATGDNDHGQLGDGWTKNFQVFVKVISDGVKAVAAGAFHSMVVKQDDSIWATGLNQHGQLGDGATTSLEGFVRLSPFRNGVGHDYVCMDINCLDATDYIHRVHSPFSRPCLSVCCNL